MARFPTRTGFAPIIAAFLLAPAPCISGMAAAATLPDPPAADIARRIEDAPAGDIAALEAILASARGPAETALVRARIAALRLDAAAVNRELDAFFASDDPPPLRALALAIRADTAFAEGDYAAAVVALEQAIPIETALGEPADVRDLEQTLSVARLLAPEPAQHVARRAPTTIATRRDKAGLPRAVVTINGAAQEAVLDTGANLSVVSESAAKRLGLRMIEGEASVGASGNAELPTRIAIADRMTIAGVTIEHVAFLVLADSRLSFPLPGGYRIDAIIGFPVFRALERIRFGADGGFTAGGRPLAGPANLRAVGNDLYVVATVNGIGAALHLDTGASSSSLGMPFAAAHPERIAGLPRTRRRIAGAGGATEQAVALWKPAIVRIGGRSATLPQVEIVLDGGPPAAANRLGVLGQDVLGAFDSYTIDFRTMRFALGAPRG